MFYLILLIGYFIICLLNKDLVIAQTIVSCKIWFFSIFSTMFLSLIIIDFIKEKFDKYNVNGYFYMLFFNIILGSIGSAKLISDSELNINKKNKMIAVSCFTSPFFISLYFYSYGYVFLLSYYIPNICYMIMYSYNIKKEKEDSKINLSISINKNLNILLTILGIIIFCNVLTSLIFYMIEFSSLNKCIISSFIEMVNGFTFIKSLNNIMLQKYLYLIFLSFLGLSIHLQINSIFKDLNYRHFFVTRLKITILSILVFSISIFNLIFFKITLIILLFCSIIKALSRL